MFEESDKKAIALSTRELREMEIFSQKINRMVEPYKEKLLKYLPLSSENLLNKLRDGVVFAYMLYKIEPERVNLKDVTVGLDIEEVGHSRPRVAFDISANHRVVLVAAKDMGLKLVNVGSSDIMEMRRSIILGLVWQILRRDALNNVNLCSHPELIKLVSSSETVGDFMHLSSEAILLRWFNYHLEKTAYKKSVTNLSSDLSDTLAYAHLLGQIVPGDSDIRKEFKNNVVDEVSKIGEDMENYKLLRAEVFMKHLVQLGLADQITTDDIISGLVSVNTLFVSDLFSRFIGISKRTDEEIKAMDHEIVSLNETIKTQKDKIEKVEIEKNKEIDRILSNIESQRKDEINQLLSDFESKKNAEISGILEDISIQQKEEIERKLSEFEHQKQKEIERKLSELESSKNEEVFNAMQLHQDLRQSYETYLLTLTDSISDILTLPKTYNIDIDPNSLPGKFVGGGNVEKSVCAGVDCIGELVGLLCRKICELEVKIKRNAEINEAMSSKVREITEGIISKRR